jgi:hypothetical protein
LPKNPFWLHKRSASVQVRRNVHTVCEKGYSDSTLNIIRQRFERSDVMGWNNARIVALCKRLNISIKALCANAGFFTRHWSERHQMERLFLDPAIARHAKQDLWPVWFCAYCQRLEAILDKKDMRGVGDHTLAEEFGRHG